MLRHKHNKRNSAQTYSEYIIMIGVIILIMVAMSPMVKRGTQGMIKLVADQVGDQKAADQFINGLNNSIDQGSYLVESYTSTRADMDHENQDRQGTTTTVFRDTTFTDSNSLLNLGYTETPQR